MDKIQQCAQNFLHLVNTTKYVFHVAKRGVRVLTLDFDLKDSSKVVYIFLKHRKGLELPCCIVSFGVKKNTAYGGQNLYWMLKDKIVSGNRITIYQHPNYSDEQKQENEAKFMVESW